MIPAWKWRGWTDFSHSSIQHRVEAAFKSAVRSAVRYDVPECYAWKVEREGDLSPRTARDYHRGSTAPLRVIFLDTVSRSCPIVDAEVG
jgi:hypothetical protein